MTNDEHIKELRELYGMAKTQGNIFLAWNILTRIHSIESGAMDPDPCGVADFRKQADEKANG